MAHIIHKSAARGRLQRKEFAAVLPELRQADAAQPGTITLATDLVPLLDQAGLGSAADELFQSVYLVHERLHRLAPEEPSHHNNLAWLAARCRRKLPEALRGAQRAVELAPASAVYADTLSEVHYQLGNHELALEYAERSVRLAPDNKIYRERLERVRKRLP